MYIFYQRSSEIENYNGQIYAKMGSFDLFENARYFE